MTIHGWIKSKLEENNLDKQIVRDLYDACKKETGCTWSFDSYNREVRRAFNELQPEDYDYDYDIDDVTKLEASKQKLLDVNNSIRKSNRENYRLYNSLDSIYQEYVDVLKKSNFSKIKIKTHTPSATGKVGILHLSDHHLNELIYECESHGNSFDFTIASKRLKKLIAESMKVFDFNKVKDLYVFFTGDLINSNRRLSEKLAQNSSLVRASLLATYLYQQMLIELSNKYSIHVASVVGNESRLDIDYDSSNILSSENWDYLIYNNLRLIFQDSPIDFIMSENNSQATISLKNGFNALILHGNTFKSSNTIDKNIASLLQNYSFKGSIINGVFFGHYHSASIGDFWSRSGSLCGANAYSSLDLNFMSRASQNIYIVNDDLSYTGIKIDLQNTDGVEGYQIEEELERYNVSKGAYNNTVVIKNLV